MAKARSGVQGSGTQGLRRRIWKFPASAFGQVEVTQGSEGLRFSVYGLSLAPNSRCGCQGFLSRQSRNPHLGMNSVVQGLCCVWTHERHPLASKLLNHNFNTEPHACFDPSTCSCILRPEDRRQGGASSGSHKRFRSS